MIWNRNTKLPIDMLKAINPTSKATLKNQCLLISGGDIQKARELYDFYIDGLEELPAFDPIPPTWQESTKKTVNGFFGWVKDNQDTLMTGVDYIRGLFGRSAIQAAEEAEEVAIEE